MATLGQRSYHKVEHPTRGRAPQPATSNGRGSLVYRGGVNGIGVTTGTPKVYLVFWGAGWGTAGTSGADVTLSGDTKNVAPVLQEFFRGLGTNNELWSGVLTQYCEGIAAGSSVCSAAAARVGYPTGGALAGVWVDSSTTAITSAGSTATSPVDHDIAAEAVLAASHFGNTTAALNRSAQYVIVSPTGTHPGGFNTTGANWCAWHDYNGDTTLIGGAATSPYGDIAFTNLPYVTDLGASCGANYVNAAASTANFGYGGGVDGVTIVEGHEYAETVTDQNPAGGWTDSIGYENGDKCAWVGVGGTGGAQNLALSTGSFAVQSTWSNDGAACLVSHAIVTSVNYDYSLTASPASVVVAPGTSAVVTVATSTLSGTVPAITLSTSAAPAGTTVALAASSVAAGASTTLTITNNTAAVGSYTVTVTGNAGGLSHTASIGASVPGVVNGSFETQFTGWTRAGTTSSVTSPATAIHSGIRSVLAGNLTNRTNGDSSLTQTFVAAGNTLSFWYLSRCGETVTADWATATLTDNTTAPATVTTPLAKTCTNTAVWTQVTATVVAGHSYTLKLVNHDNNLSGTGKNTYTYFDDVTA
jgi:serine protease